MFSFITCLHVSEKAKLLSCIVQDVLTVLSVIRNLDVLELPNHW